MKQFLFNDSGNLLDNGNRKLSDIQGPLFEYLLQQDTIHWQLCVQFECHHCADSVNLCPIEQRWEAKRSEGTLNDWIYLDI